MKSRRSAGEVQASGQGSDPLLPSPAEGTELPGGERVDVLSALVAHLPPLSFAQMRMREDPVLQPPTLVHCQPSAR